MEGGEWQRSCAHVWFLLLLIPCFAAIHSACHSQAQGNTYAQRTTCRLGRKETGGTSNSQGGSGILPEDKGMEGAACHPGTAQSPTYALAQAILSLCFLGLAPCTTHPVRLPCAASQGVRDCLSLGSTHHFVSQS